MTTTVRIRNLGPGEVKVSRTSIKPYTPHQELARLKVGEAQEMDCYIADLLIEEI
jgi:hypothetical protein